MHISDARTGILSGGKSSLRWNSVKEVVIVRLPFGNDLYASPRNPFLLFRSSALSMHFIRLSFAWLAGAFCTSDHIMYLLWLYTASPDSGYRTICKTFNVVKGRKFMTFLMVY